jgi:hypothetical protein
MFGRKLQIALDVALRIDHGSRACRFVSDQVRSVRQAIQIKLFKDHASLFFSSSEHYTNRELSQPISQPTCGPR